MSLTIQLPHFEGPLGLLLYLIRKEEMDIMDIKIHEITAQYLEYIKIMKELDIEVAGEFIAMAATLIQIKSRMLLPQYNEAGEIVETQDPRKELVQKLLEYQKYQEAAKLLADRPWVGRDIWLRGVRERLENKDDSIEIDESGLFGLISAYRVVLRTAKKRIHKVAAKTKSIAGRIMEIKERLIVGIRTTLADLVVETEDRARQTLITFLSLLELGKMGFVRIAQAEPYADLWVEPVRAIETDVLSRVEEYDNMNSEDVANQLIETPAAAEAGEFVLTDAEDMTVLPATDEPSDFMAAAIEEIDPETMVTDEELLAEEGKVDGEKAEV